MVSADGDETGGPSAAGLVISPTGKGGFFRNSVASPLLTPIMPSRPLAWPTSVESDEEEDEEDDFHGDGGGGVTNFSRSSLASRLKKSLSTPSFRSFLESGGLASSGSADHPEDSAATSGGPSRKHLLPSYLEEDDGEATSSSDDL